MNFIKKHSHSECKAFTLVELIVVVTILAILATIWFVSYSSYLTWVRDTNRLAQLVSIHDGLNLYSTKNDLPIPDDNVWVVIGTETIAYQWYAGSNTLESIDFTKWWKDPKDDVYFTYYLTKDRKYFQLMAFLEEEWSATTNFGSQAFAADYSSRVSTVFWKKLWVLTNLANTPIQEINSLTTAWNLNVTDSTIGYIAHLTDDIKLWDNELTAINPTESCNRIRQIKWSSPSWTYTLKPSWSPEIDVYCDMSSGDWWWIRVNSELLWSEYSSNTTSNIENDGKGVNVSVNSVFSVCTWAKNHAIEIAPQIEWSKIKYTQEFTWAASCWSIFWDDRNWYTTNLIPFDTNIDQIEWELRMNTLTEDWFDGTTYRCDNLTTTNFWHWNKWIWLREATVTLRRNDMTTTSSISTYVDCNTNPINWKIKDIYVQ